MTEATRDHLLAATHFVLGPTNFLVLRLPGNWDLRIGRNPYEIDYSVQLGDVRWAQEGRASAFLIDEKAKRAIELDVHTSRGGGRAPGIRGATAGVCRVGGHPAEYLLGEAHLGLFHTKLYRVLRVTYRCEATRRDLSMRFLARAQPEEFMALLPFLEGSRCH